MNFRARYWHSEGTGVRCELCPNMCFIEVGRQGRCLGRRNVEGHLCATSYGEVVSLAVDPIEKKPLYHFHPGENVLSVSTYGCNLACPFCQNSEISQREAPSRYVGAEELVDLARRSGTLGVAFTYAEPLVWFEYLMDACPRLRAAGFRTVLVTNGMINPAPLVELLPHVDAMNIDLKSMRPEFYDDYLGGRLDSVLSTIQTASQQSHVEITNLLIPGLNDADADINALVDFVAGRGHTAVLHFSRYFPRYHAQEPVTPAETLLRAGELARSRLNYVYLGNLEAGVEWRNTRCPRCSNTLVERAGFSAIVAGIADGVCASCGRPVDMVLSGKPV